MAECGATHAGVHALSRPLRLPGPNASIAAPASRPRRVGFGVSFSAQTLQGRLRGGAGGSWWFMAGDARLSAQGMPLGQVVHLAPYAVFSQYPRIALPGPPARTARESMRAMSGYSSVLCRCIAHHTCQAYDGLARDVGIRVYWQSGTSYCSFAGPRRSRTDLWCGGGMTPRFHEFFARFPAPGPAPRSSLSTTMVARQRWRSNL